MKWSKYEMVSWGLRNFAHCSAGTTSKTPAHTPLHTHKVLPDCGLKPTMNAAEEAQQDRSDACA